MALQALQEICRNGILALTQVHRLPLYVMVCFVLRHAVKLHEQAFRPADGMNFGNLLPEAGIFFAHRGNALLEGCTLLDGMEKITPRERFLQ